MPRKTPRRCKECGKPPLNSRNPRCAEHAYAKQRADKRRAYQNARIRAQEARGAPESPQAYPKPVKQTDPAYRAWVRKQGCILQHTWACRGRWGGFPVVDFAHVKTRGARGPDWGNGVPLCEWHHDQMHVMGIKTFQRHYGLDLHQIAQDLARAYKRQEWPE